MAYQGRFEAKSRNPKSGTPRPMTREDSINAGRTTRQDAAQAARQPAPQARQAAPEARQAAPQTPVRKGPRTSTVIFYTIYFLIIIVSFWDTVDQGCQKSHSHCRKTQYFQLERKRIIPSR